MPRIDDSKTMGSKLWGQTQKQWGQTLRFPQK